MVRDIWMMHLLFYEKSKIHRISPNPATGTLPRRQGRDFVTFHGFFTFGIYFFHHPNAAHQKKIYANLIISSETLISMHSLMGVLRDPAVPALDFRGTTTIFQNSHYRAVQVSTEGAQLWFPMGNFKNDSKSRAGTAGSQAVSIILCIKMSVSDDMIRFA